MEIIVQYAPYIVGGVITLAVLGAVILAIMFRVVVETNEVHIVQTGRKTVSYGKDQPGGNVYYAWPSWFPIIGVKVSNLPMSVFDVDLDGYEAYDKARVPFKIDVMAFFRIFDSNLAAQRVSSFDELKVQLQGILQGSCRAILASSDIETILGGRSEFGQKFTDEVDENLKNWGVQTVKTIELMDIRDASESKVILNIMAKNKSVIERESRVVVADNMRQAQEAEVTAQRQVELAKQEAIQAIGQRTAENEKQVGIAKEQAQQEIKEQARITATKDMAVKQVNAVRTAEIQREVILVAADQEKKKVIIEAEATKETDIVKAQGHQQQTVIIAEGDLKKAQLNAQGIQAEGVAKGVAEKAILMAPVDTQITLAKEIGANQAYQQYLITIREIEKNQAVGIEQAGALKAAEIKVIANTGEVSNGINEVMDIFSSKGGTAIGAMVEALKQTPGGAALVDRVTGHKGNGAVPH